MTIYWEIAQYVLILLLIFFIYYKREYAFAFFVNTERRDTRLMFSTLYLLSVGLALAVFLTKNNIHVSVHIFLSILLLLCSSNILILNKKYMHRKDVNNTKAMITALRIIGTFLFAVMCYSDNIRIPLKTLIQGMLDFL